MKKNNMAFSFKPIILLLAFALGLFSLSILLHAYNTSPEKTGKKSDPGSFSLSALGYAGFYDLLLRLDQPATRSIGHPFSMVGAQGTLIVAEPQTKSITDEYVMDLVQAPRVLLVLPKWSGVQDPQRPEWILGAAPESRKNAQYILALVSRQSTIVRDDWPATWENNEIGNTPTGSGVVQLIQSQHLRPIVGSAKGMLVGELIVDGNKKIWVLSDPDVMANHGIGKGDNATFMIALLDQLRHWNTTDSNARIIFDETVHGFKAAQGSPLRLAFSFPFVIVIILLCCTGVLLLLAGSRRFGAARIPPPPLDYGKETLIGNSARLLDYAGHHAPVLKRYIRAAIRSAAHALHAPSGLDEQALMAWLNRVGKARGVHKSCSDIVMIAASIDDTDKKQLSALFACVQDIYRWKGEILHERR